MKFFVENEIPAGVGHKNLLTSHGYCVRRRPKMILVYDCVPNLSLCFVQPDCKSPT